MATIFIDKSDGMIAVRDSYDVKEKCSSAGCFWDGDSKLWKMVFTLDTFERLIKKIPEANIDPYVFKALESQKNKEDKLAELREKASRNEDIHFRVLGLKANPFPYQKLGILYAVTNGNGMMIGDSMGLGKALVSNTHIFTPTGKVEIGSLKVGDKVIGRNGKECTVTGVYPQGFEDIYRITFTDGFWIDCGPEHLWEVSSPCSNRQEKNSFVFSVSQLNDPHGNYSHFGYGHNEKKEYRIKTYYKYKNGNNRWSIPIVEPIRFTSKPVPIDPYLLGIFLGDGHISKRGYVSITKRLEDLQEMVIKSVKPNKGKPHLGKCFFSEYSQSIIEFGLNGKRSWEKHIPALYKYNSPNIRLALLQGLMDTDGSAGDGTTEYSTSSKSLCDDVVELVQSLGGIVRLRTRIPVYTYNGVKKKGRTSYRLNIKLHPSMNPFRLQRKAKKYLVPEKYVPARYIDRIEKLPEQQETVCIAVDSEDHLYVAEHCIVTHNTMQAIASALILKQKGLVKNCLVITPASLKFNWPLEIEKFTNETCLVINGKKPEDRIAQWLDDSCFFKIANYELVVEDLGAGREYKEKKGEDPEQTKKRVARKVKQFIKQKKLAQVKEKVWDLIILDECFPYHTKITTDQGQIPIGEIVENQLQVSVWCKDSSINEPSIKRVVRWVKKPLVKKLVEVVHERGRFVCTEDHKIWTREEGYVKAKSLCIEGRSLSLLTLSSGIPKIQKREKEKGILFQGLCGGTLQRQEKKDLSEERDCKDVHVLRKRIPSTQCLRKQSEVLQSEMFSIEPDHDRGGPKKSHSSSFKRFGAESRKPRHKEPTIINTDEIKKSRSCFQGEGDGWSQEVERESPELVGSKRWERILDRTTEKTPFEAVGGLANGIFGGREREIQRGHRISSEPLCDRYRKPCFEDSNRSGWDFSSDKEMETDRFEERKGIASSRVESVAFLEQRDYDRLGLSSPENSYVYDLEVEEHHNYFADGVLVSNCHACKHGTSKRHKAVKAMKAKMKIGLSGTPMDGRLEELFTLMGIIAPGILGSRTSFFTRYVTTDFFGNVKGYKNIQEVQEKIAPFFIRRMKKDVLKDLPEKLYENKVIALTDEELKIYNAIKKGKHPSVIDKDGKVAEPMVRAIRCMQFVNFPQMVDSSCKASTKLDVFRDVVEELVQMNGQKIIIFTQFKQILNLVDQILKEMKLKFLRIDGDTDKVLRADYQKLFNEDPTIDCIIGTDAMSTGLNLIGGDTVLNLTQSWQPAIMSQREDRSYRIGRKENVTVLNFLCKDTIEEKIRRVLYSKDKITSETLGDGTDEAVLRKLGPQEIEDLL